MPSIHQNSQTYQEICEILCHYDPIGLVKMGAPPDEYDSEAETIHENLLRKKYVTVRALRKMIWTVFVSMFEPDTGLAGTEENYQDIAEKIFSLMSQ